MGMFFRNLVAQEYKIVISYLKWVHLGIPILGISLFGSYFLMRAGISADTKMLWYLQAVCCAFPMVIAIVTAVLHELDERAGGCQLMLTVPACKIFGQLSNLLALLLAGCFSTIFSVAGFGTLLCLDGGSLSLVRKGLVLSVIVFAGNLSVYLMSYMITYSFGTNPGLGFGIVGSLCSALFILPLGDVIWSYIPFGYGIRISLGFLYADSETLSLSMQLFRQDVQQGIPKVILITILLVFFFAIWSEKWQNKHVAEM